MTTVQEGDLKKECLDLFCNCIPSRKIERKDAINPLFKVLIVAIGFMTDAYDIFIFGIVTVIMGGLNPNDNTATAKSVLGISIVAGTLGGQLLFGPFGDMFGRKKVFFVTLTNIILFAFLSAFAFDINETYYISLTILRIVLGFGIGGEYPLSATIAAESIGSEKSRGFMMATVFSTQGIGNFLAPCVVAILLATGMPLEAVWRVGLGLGCVPALCIIYWRQKLEETHVNVKKKPADPKLIAKHAWNLFGTASTWFLFDIAFYGNGFFKETIIDLIGLGGTGTLYDQMIQTANGSLVIAALALPGYWCSLPLIELIGRKPLQMIGFAGEAILFFILGGLWDQILKIPGLFIVLYGLTFFFSNMGPNTTTYVLSAESYPKEIRSTCHGISSASGKAGALIGVAGFPVMVAAYPGTTGVSYVFFLCGAILVAGFVLTWIFIDETKGRILEQNVELERLSVPYDEDKRKDKNSEETKERPLSSDELKDKPHEKSEDESSKKSEDESSKKSEDESSKKSENESSKKSEKESKDESNKKSEDESSDKENGEDESSDKENGEDETSDKENGEDESSDKENGEDESSDKENGEDEPQSKQKGVVVL